MEQRARVADALSLTRRWWVANVAAAAVLPDRSTVFVGPPHHVFRLASISKMLVGWAALLALLALLARDGLGLRFARLQFHYRRGNRRILCSLRNRQA